MPISRPRLTRPLPRPTPRRAPWRATKRRPGGQLPFSSLFGTWNFAVAVYVAWDPPTTANPAWIDVTEFVHTDPGIVIGRGRPDGQSDPSVGTCTLTVDNSDGRWSAANPNGPWYGQIHKGAWLRVDLLPPSGIASTRFVGFITSLPVGWSGLYATTQIQASDRFLLLGQARQHYGAIIEQSLAGTGATYVQAAYPLHEPAGSFYVSDVSGNSNTLTVVGAGGVQAGQLITFSSAQAPGFDGLQSLTCAPAGYDSANAAYRTGSYLAGTVGPLGAAMEIGCWVQTTYAYQSTSANGNPVWCLYDPDNQINIVLSIDNAGTLSVSQGQMTAAGFPTVLNFGWSFAPSNGYPLGNPINDGRWHQVVVRLQSTGSSSTSVNGPQAAYVSLVVDGMEIGHTVGATNPSANFGMPTTMSQFVLGGAISWNGDGAYQRPALYVGNLSDVVIYTLPSTSTHPDWYSPAVIGLRGITESAAERVERIASYTGVPVPTTTTALPGNGALVAVQTAGVNTLINLPASGHQCGTQSIAGRSPLDVMREAAHTENMPLFIDRLGRITLQTAAARYNPTAVWSVNALDLQPDLTPQDDFMYVVNQVTVTPNGTAAKTVIGPVGAASQAKYGVYSQSVSSASISTVQATSLGLAVIAPAADPPPRYSPLTVEAATLATQSGYGAAWYDAVLASEISTVITVTNLPSQAPASSVNVFIEGYTETISAGTHVIAFSTSTVPGFPYFTLDDPVLGLLDSNNIIGY